MKRTVAFRSIVSAAALVVLGTSIAIDAQTTAPPPAPASPPPAAAAPAVPSAPGVPVVPAAPVPPAVPAVPNAPNPASLPAAQATTMQLASTSFPEGGEIPEVHTCKGADASPPLAWSGAPAGTKSFALIVDDPDAPDPAAPKKTFVHWLLYDIEPSSASLSQDYGRSDPGLPVRAGTNDFARTGYGGPCPPIGRHRYFFKLYALDTVLGDLGKPDKAALEKAMEGHVLATAQLLGTFRK